VLINCLAVATQIVQLPSYTPPFASILFVSLFANSLMVGNHFGQGKCQAHCISHWLHPPLQPVRDLTGYLQNHPLTQSLPSPARKRYMIFLDCCKITHWLRLSHRSPTGSPWFCWISAEAPADSVSLIARPQIHPWHNPPNLPRPLSW